MEGIGCRSLAFGVIYSLQVTKIASQPYGGYMDLKNGIKCLIAIDCLKIDCN